MIKSFLIFTLAFFFIFSVNALADPCVTLADQKPCDSKVNFTELMVHVDNWYKCSSCVPDLSEALMSFFDLPFCGNCRIDGTESCDDCNKMGGDGCSAYCSDEAGWTCSGEPSVCVSDEVTDGLIHWWKFDESIGTSVDETVEDSSGDLDGTIKGGSIVAGRYGNAIELGGGSDQILLPDADLNPEFNFTASLWFKKNNSGDSGTILTNGGESFYLKYSLAAYGKIYFRAYNKGKSSEYVTSGSGSVNDISWHHVAFGYESNKIFLYLDGYYEGTYEMVEDFNEGIGEAAIGNSLLLNAGFVGLVDDIRIYDRVLTEEEIIKLNSTIPVCNFNGTCDSYGGENCFNCPVDCGCAGGTGCVGTTCVTCIDKDNDGFSVTGGGCGLLDCNDVLGTGESIFPGADELCDGIDNDCDLEIDGLPSDPLCAGNPDGDYCIDGSCQECRDDVHCGVGEMCDQYNNICMDDPCYLITCDTYDGNQDSCLNNDCVSCEWDSDTSDCIMPYLEAHYVNPDSLCSGDDCDGTSWENGWKSLADIDWDNRIDPGDVIYISGGTTSQTYYENLGIGKSGEQGLPITIRIGQDPGHDGMVILNGKQDGQFIGEFSGIYIDDHDIVISGKVRDDKKPRINITNFYFNGITFSKNPYNLDLGYLNIQHNGRKGSYVCALYGQVCEHPNFGEIHHSDIHDQIGGDLVIFVTVQRDYCGERNEKFGSMRIHNNKFYNFHADGLKVNYRGMDIYNNSIGDRGIFYGDHPDGIQGWSSYLRIYNNHFKNFIRLDDDIDTNAYIRMNPDNINGDDFYSNLQIYNNIFAETRDPPILGYCNGDDEKALVCNSNSDCDSGQCFHMLHRGIELSFGSSFSPVSNVHNVTVANNVFKRINFFGLYFGLRHVTTKWKPDTQYDLYDRLIPETENSYYYFAIENGTSKSTEPEWCTDVGCTVIDGGNTWKNNGLASHTSDTVSNIRIENNIFQDMQRKGFGGSSYIGLEEWHESITTGSHDSGAIIIVDYNILNSSDTDLYSTAYMVISEASGNKYIRYDEIIQETNYQDNGIYTDSKLDANYRPVLGSSAINTGADLSGIIPSVDRDGKAREPGAWDIGAYEYTP